MAVHRCNMAMYVGVHMYIVYTIRMGCMIDTYLVDDHYHMHAVSFVQAACMRSNVMS